MGTKSRTRWNTLARFRGALRGLFFSQGVQLLERIGVAEEPLRARLSLCNDEAARRRIESALSCLTKAIDAATNGQIDTGWAYLHRAREIEIMTYSEEELTTSAIELSFEARGGKLRDWRKAAVLDFVQRITEPMGEPATIEDRRQWLASATKVRNESLGGEYRALALLRQQQAVLLVLGVLILIPVTILLVQNGDRFDDPKGLGQGWVVGDAVLIGAVGAVTSALQRSVKRKWQRVPEQIWSFVSSLSRPLIGLVSGLTVYLAARTGIVTPESHVIAVVLLASFGAGFSERLVLRTLGEDQRTESGPHEAIETFSNGGSSPPRAGPARERSVDKNAPTRHGSGGDTSP